MPRVTPPVPDVPGHLWSPKHPSPSVLSARNSSSRRTRIGRSGVWVCVQCCKLTGMGVGDLLWLQSFRGASAPRALACWQNGTWGQRRAGQGPSRGRARAGRAEQAGALVPRAWLSADAPFLLFKLHPHPPGVGGSLGALGKRSPEASLLVSFLLFCIHTFFFFFSSEEISSPVYLSSLLFFFSLIRLF